MGFVKGRTAAAGGAGKGEVAGAGVQWTAGHGGVALGGLQTACGGMGLGRPCKVPINDWARKKAMWRLRNDELSKG